MYGTSVAQWSGISVDEQFLELLRSIFGRQTITQFTTKHVGDFLTMTFDFEERKILVPFRDTKIIIRIPATLSSLYSALGGKSLKEKVSSLRYGNKITVKGEKLIIEGVIVTQWLELPIKNFVAHIKYLFEQPSTKDVSQVLLIGGFGEHQLVIKKLRKELRYKNILPPLDATLCTVRGAVVFGQDIRKVSRRSLKYTYGIDGFIDFDKKNHPPEHLIIRHGKAVLKNAFITFVTAGQPVDLYEEVKMQRLPTDVNYSTIRIFRCRRPNPTLTTEKECEPLGMLRVEHYERCSLDDKKMEITFQFGGTELTVRAKLALTGEEFYVTLDLE